MYTMSEQEKKLVNLIKSEKYHIDYGWMPIKSIYYSHPKSFMIRIPTSEFYPFMEELKAIIDDEVPFLDDGGFEVYLQYDHVVVNLTEFEDVIDGQADNLSDFSKLFPYNLYGNKDVLYLEGTEYNQHNKNSKK